MYTIDHEDDRHEILTEEEFKDRFKDKLTLDFFHKPFDKHYVNVDGEKLIITLI